ncbi:MAG: hypothetical protein A2505_05890 [Deltaproteobacteria bacterium RIFOXYD12_FULL_55_16]|nr:MAG: hypothetical protein A2505_05890 [Deltaproteobacteria bacterium RIFOXYD12_FULL_55_16]
MNSPITIGISACLFGKNTRYDGGHRHQPQLIEALRQFVTLLPLCPEVECGLGIPREPMRLEGDPEGPRLLTITSRRDLTAPMLAWAAQRLEAFAKEGLQGLILKSRSPSCGARVAVHGEGEAAFSPGLFVRACQERFPDLPIANEEELCDPARLAAFLKRVTDHK